jgi:siroheme decarboxylase
MITPTHPTSLDVVDRHLLDECQSAFPLVERPYAEIATRIGCAEEEVLQRIETLRAAGLIRRISAIFDSNTLGYQSVLLAFEIPPERLESAAQQIAQHPGITHHYQRGHAFNLWSALTVPSDADLHRTAETLANVAQATRWLFLPTVRVFKIGVNFPMSDEAPAPTAPRPTSNFIPPPLSEHHREAVRLLQTDLPVTSEPFRVLIETTSKNAFTPQTLLQYAHEFIDNQIMRRYASVLGHQAAGYAHNLLTAWNIPETQSIEMGKRMASVAGVSHCYQRMPHPPDWPYTHFAMLHARTENEAQGMVEQVATATGIHDYAVLKTLKEFKKTRMLYFI